MKWTLAIIFILASLGAFCQSTSNFSGVVSDQLDQSLIGVTLILTDDIDTLYTATNNEGAFEFTDIKTGRYSLEASYIGFQTQRNVEILLESGRNLELDIHLSPSTANLPTAVVRGNREINSLQQLPSIQQLTIEETRRFPATFNDPARLALSYAGVANANDQANGLIIRGNSPASISWRVEGAEIVNPNHLSNAGTRTDRISDASGGVNILSAQMLSTTNFISGVTPAQYGNSQGGVLDMSFRNGNTKTREHMLQIGLLGIDASTEGPFNKDGKASYLFNYRYSTLGLFELLGVQISEESINFQDIAFKVNLPSKKAGSFSLFAMGGSSNNVFTAAADSTEWLSTRDRTNVDYGSKMGLVGITHNKFFGEKSISWKTSAVYSASSNERTASNVTYNNVPAFSLQESILETKLNVISSVKHWVNSRWNYEVGLDFLNNKYSLKENCTDQCPPNWIENASSIFVNANFKIGSKLNLYSGLRGSYFQEAGQPQLDPNFILAYQANAKNKISVAGGTSSRFFPKYLYPSIIRRGTIKSTKLSLNYDLNIKQDSEFSIKAFYQHLSKVPTFTENDNLIHTLNFEEIETVPSPIVNYGQGRNFGVELSYQKYLSKSFYYLLNTTLFKSEFENSNSEWQSTRYDSKFIANATVGKEFNWQKKWSKTLGINIRANVLGGQYYTPIDLDQSIIQRTEILNSNAYFQEQWSPYFKGDLRIYLRTSKKKTSNNLSLDVQNFTNQKNNGFTFYDPDTGTIQLKKQLGLIPILSWRLEF